MKSKIKIFKNKLNLIFCLIKIHLNKNYFKIVKFKYKIYLYKDLLASALDGYSATIFAYG